MCEPFRAEKHLRERYRQRDPARNARNTRTGPERGLRLHAHGRRLERQRHQERHREQTGDAVGLYRPGHRQPHRHRNRLLLRFRPAAQGVCDCGCRRPRGADLRLLLRQRLRGGRYARPCARLARQLRTADRGPGEQRPPAHPRHPDQVDTAEKWAGDKYEKRHHSRPAADYHLGPRRILQQPLSYGCKRSGRTCLYRLRGHRDGADHQLLGISRTRTRNPQIQWLLRHADGKL